MAKSGEQTEIIVSILTVVAIFSFAGILSWDGARDGVSEMVSPSVIESEVVGGSAAMMDLPEEALSVVETVEAEVGSASSPALGTSLSPAVSTFSVEAA